MNLFWNIYSYFYNLGLKLWLPYHKLVQDILTKLEINDQDYILDAGCGTGYLILEILKRNSQKNLKIKGIDSSRQMLKYARKKCSRFPNVSIESVDLNDKLPYEDESFSKIASCNVLYTLKNPEFIIREFYRVIKEGGTLVAANPKPDSKGKFLFQEQIKLLKQLSPFSRRLLYTLLFFLFLPFSFVIMLMNKIIEKKAKEGEFHFFNKEELEELLKKAGFKNIQFFSAYADQDFLVIASK